MSEDPEKVEEEQKPGTGTRIKEKVKGKLPSGKAGMNSKIGLGLGIVSDILFSVGLIFSMNSLIVAIVNAASYNQYATLVITGWIVAVIEVTVLHTHKIVACWNILRFTDLHELAVG